MYTFVLGLVLCRVTVIGFSRTEGEGQWYGVLSDDRTEDFVFYSKVTKTWNIFTLVYRTWGNKDRNKSEMKLKNKTSFIMTLVKMFPPYKEFNVTFERFINTVITLYTKDSMEIVCSKYIK